LTQRPSYFTSGKKIRYPFSRRLGGPQDLSGRLRKKSLPTEIRFPDRPVRRDSLYPLSYSGPFHLHAPENCVLPAFSQYGESSTVVLFLSPQHDAMLDYAWRSCMACINDGCAKGTRVILQISSWLIKSTFTNVGQKVSLYCTHCWFFICPSNKTSSQVTVLLSHYSSTQSPPHVRPLSYHGKHFLFTVHI
jgi:hypothetical protein